jgi:ribosomal protein S4
LIIGFGFGSPLIALTMLIITSIISYSLFKAYRSKRYGGEYDGEYHYNEREQRRAYYRQMREEARRLKQYDLTDEEIERKLDEEFNVH